MKTMGAGEVGHGARCMARRRAASASRRAGLPKPFADAGIILGGLALEGPFYEGQNAFDRGEARDGCPHHAPAVRQRWLEGWREAKRYADVQAIIAAARAAAPLSPALFARMAGDEPRSAG